MRCYNCYGFVHKAQDCASARRQPMLSALYTSARKSHEPWKANYVGRIESHKTCAQIQGQTQLWVKYKFLLNVNEVDQCTEYGFHVASQA